MPGKGPNRAERRFEKSLLQQVRDLDDHVYLLSGALNRLQGERVHFKTVAAELRLLVCLSSKKEGLLWRVADTLNVSDVMRLHAVKSYNKDHPMMRKTAVMLHTVYREGECDFPLLPPAGCISLREFIKSYPAVFVYGKEINHEYLIKSVAQQIGSSHEDADVEPMLVDLSELFIGGVEVYVPILAKDASLTIEIGERVLAKAVAEHDYVRVIRPNAGASPP